MSEFNFSPSIPPRKDSAPRINSSTLGDGYELRSPDGINTLAQVWSLSFNGKSDTDADAIESFLEGKNAVTKFTWTPPNSTEISVICKRWSRSFQGTTNNLTMTFTQVFET